MKKNGQLNSLENERGQPLLVVVLMILALSAAAGIWLVSGRFLKDEEAYKVTMDRMIRLGRAIRPDDFSKQIQPRSYSQDAGQIPTTLTALTTNSDALGACGLDATTRQFTGWCGPYWGTSVSGENGFADGWGTTMVYNTSTCSITSYGPNAVNNSGATDDIVYKVGTESYKNAVLSDKPALYFRLGETSGTVVNDLSLNNTSGTLYNTPTLSVAGAILGDRDTAMTFDGTTEYIDVTNSANVDFDRGNSFSIEYWLKTNNSSFSFIAGKASGAVGYYVVNCDATGACGSTAGVPSLILRQTATSDDTMTRGVSGSAANDNAWNHLVATYDGTKTAAGITLYKNGAAVGTTSVNDTAGQSIKNVTPFRIAARSDGSYYSGSLDEVAVYPYVLTSGQVSAHYKIGKCIK